jgi:drug/metabolite transporter (DMT)-like permease
MSLSGYLFSISSVALMAIAGPFQKIAMEGLVPGHVVFFSSLSAFFASLMYALITKDRLQLKMDKTIISLSILYAIAQVAFTFAISFGNPVIVNATSRSYLAFNFLLSYFVLGERFTPVQIFAVLLILAGTIGLSFFSSTETFVWSIGAVLTLIYAFFFSVHNCLLKSKSTKSFLSLLMLQSGLTCVSLGVINIINGYKFFYEPTSIFWASSSGLLSSFLGFIFFHQGLKNLSFSEASSIRSLSPIIGIVVIYPFFPVYLNLIQKLSLVTIIVGSLSYTLKGRSNGPA